MEKDKVNTTLSFAEMAELGRKKLEKQLPVTFEQARKQVRESMQRDRQYRKSEPLSISPTMSQREMVLVARRFVSERSIPYDEAFAQVRELKEQSTQK